MYTLIPISYHLKNHIYYSKDPAILKSSIPNELKNPEVNNGTKNSIKKTIRKIFGPKGAISIPASTLRRNEVERSTVVASIGDLHGNYDALIGNLEHLGLINEQGMWRGNDTKLVIHGDIFADRHGDSIKIAHYLTKLGESAKKYNGEISILAGNHDDIAFAYLTGEAAHNDEKEILINLDSMSGAQVGLYELIDHGASINYYESPLIALRGEKKGRETLEFMCKMKVLDQIDDTLFIHVVPHKKMLDLIIKMGITNINTIYQKGMRQCLLEDIPLTEGETYLFKEIRKIFLDTSRRKTPDENNTTQEYIKLKEMGINLVINGHDSTNAGEYIEINEVGHTGVDFKYRMKDKYNTPSTLVIEKNSSIRYGNSIQSTK